MVYMNSNPEFNLFEFSFKKKEFYEIIDWFNQSYGIDPLLIPERHMRYIDPGLKSHPGVYYDPSDPFDEGSCNFMMLLVRDKDVASHIKMVWA